MIQRRLSRLADLENDLPRAVRVGRRLTYSALLLAVVALVGVGILANSKADRASDDAQAARRQASLAACVLANAFRADNPDRPASSTELGVYNGNVWAFAYTAFGCRQFTPAELASAIPPTPARTASPAPRPLPTRSPGG